eukprot:2396386-Amphidinium_carterae.2
METNFSANGMAAAKVYLKIWNNWTPTSIQGPPTLPIGHQAQAMDDREVWSSLWTNNTGLVPAHMPWDIIKAIEWMEPFPCLENNICLVEEEGIDAYGRFHETNSIDMRFNYLTLGDQIGGMKYHDMWFEERCVRKDLRSTKVVEKLVMVTTSTFKISEDPYNGGAGNDDDATPGDSVSAVG